MTTTKLAHQAAMHLPPELLQTAKRAVRFPRYYAGLAAARRGWRAYGHRYRHNWIFVAGLPKSGTSWIESMLAAYPGFSLVSHPEITMFDYARGGSHAFELPEDFFTRLGNALCVVKIHCHGSANNKRVLERAGIPYTILHRDLRDAAVSHVHYVQRTPWHPEYQSYRRLDVQQALVHFGQSMLPAWRDWIASWKRWRDPERSLEIRYEDLLQDTAGWMRRLAEFYELPLEPVEAIVNANRFDNVKSKGTFFRKGQRGDWANHFDAQSTALFKQEVGAELVEWGYESGLDW